MDKSERYISLQEVIKGLKVAAKTTKWMLV